MSRIIVVAPVWSFPPHQADTGRKGPAGWRKDPAGCRQYAMTRMRPLRTGSRCGRAHRRFAPKETRSLAQAQLLVDQVGVTAALGAAVPASGLPPPPRR